MRLLMVSDVSFPRVNGVSTSIATFRQSLAEQGHQITLIAPAYPMAAPDEPDVIRIPSLTVPRDPEDRLTSWRRILALAPLFAARGFDAIHSHTPFAAHCAGVALGRRLRLPVVETDHTFFEEYLHHYLPLLPRSLTRLLARRVSVAQCNAVDALLVPSIPMLERLRHYGVNAPTEVLPTGLDLNRFRGGDGAAFRARHGIDAARLVLLHISRVAHEKNIDFVFESLVLIRRRIPNVLLVVAGERPALSHLRRLADRRGLQRNVPFVGYLDRAITLLDCYRAGDAFVFASRTETQGLVLLEELALGVPVVSTAVMGTADVLREVRGALIAPDAVAGFAATVTRVRPDPPTRRADRRRRWRSGSPPCTASSSAEGSSRAIVVLRPQCRRTQHADRVAPSDARGSDA